jgi:geranylgeranyl pyrophosphate synthase
VDLAAERAAVGTALAAAANRYLASLPADVADAIRYAVLGEGKRLRGVLVLASYRAAGGQGDASTLAAAVEIVHAYSLVHDDLPCMDDDDVRRGRPTLHKAFGVRTATAAGLAMVPLAAHAAYDGAIDMRLPPAVAGEIVRELMHASGAAGMIGGQLLDLEGEGSELPLARLERIHALKTGALITASVRLGGIAARAPAPVLGALEQYGRAVGLAFQIADDVLDVTATTDQIGKTVGRDVALRKSTYPAVLGVAGAVERANALAEAACRALDAVGICTPSLAYLARFSVERSA